MIRAVLLLLAMAAGSAMAFAQSDEFLAKVGLITPAEAQARKQAIIHARWMVTVDVQMVELDDLTAFDLIPHLQSTNQDEVDQAWSRVQAMLKTGQAKLVAWPMVRAADGSRAVSETILEKRTASEFEPPQEPTTFSPYPQPKAGPMNAATAESTPIAFETRNQGVMLEVEPVVRQGGQRVGLQFACSRVKLLTMEGNGLALTTHNTLITVPQPLFETLSSKLVLNLKSGQRELLAVHKLKLPGNTIELDFVRAMITKAE